MVVMWIIYAALCALVGYLGRERKLGFWPYFGISLLLSPLMGIIIVLVSEKKKTATEVDEEAPAGA